MQKDIRGDRIELHWCVIMVNQYPDQERRKNKRLNVNFIVIFQVNRPAHVLMLIGGREIDALMLDISETGVALVSNYNIPISTSLAIKFTFINVDAVTEDERVRSMEITGEVRNNTPEDRKEYRLGIVFTHIDPGDKEAIDRFVQMNIQK